MPGLYRFPTTSYGSYPAIKNRAARGRKID
jgi:hypothetical protein